MRSKSSAQITFRSSNFVSTTKGSLLDFYDVRTLLGQGGFGKVYSAVSRATGAIYAIKALDKTTLTKQSAERVQREIEILKTLDHPNIVRVIEVIEDQRYINIVQGLCTGGELFDRILKQKVFSEEASARIMYQIFSAVNHCHRLHIVHRDLKPENILFETEDPASLLKVIDFGISTKYLQGDPLRKKYGTIGGAPPFAGRNVAEIIAKVKKGQYSMESSVWESVSDLGKDLVTKMLTFDPEQRITVEEAFNHPWLRASIRCCHKPEEAALCLTNLNRFRSVDKVKSAALNYIATKVLTEKEIDELRRAFYLLDTDGDGRLSREELLVGYQASSFALTNLDEIIANCDTDKSGLVDYSEFLTAATEWQVKLTKEMIEKAFRAFDQDSSGTITKAELRCILGRASADSDEIWADLVQEADVNQDGVVTAI